MRRIRFNLVMTSLFIAAMTLACGNVRDTISQKLDSAKAKTISPPQTNVESEAQSNPKIQTVPERKGNTIPIDADRLTVRTDPPGCLILLDGRVAGRSPLTVLAMPTRTISIRAEKAGYTTVEKDVMVGGGIHVIMDMLLAATSQKSVFGPDADMERFRVTGVQNDDVLNLRAGPGSQHRILEKIQPDAEGITLRNQQEVVDGQTWQQVEWSGEVGWVNASYLTSERTPKSQPAGLGVNTNTDWSEWLEKPLSWGDVHGIDGGNLCLFRNYFYAVNGYAFESADLASYFGSFSWYKINPAFKEEIIPPVQRGNIRFLQKAGEQFPYITDYPDPKSATLKINDDNVNLRAGPSLGDKVLFSLDSGDFVYILGRTAKRDKVTTTVLQRISDYWFKVQTELGAQAWVFGFFVEFPDQSAKEAVKPLQG